MAKQPHQLNFPSPKFDYSQIIKKIGDANRALGELKGLSANIPNPDLLTKEAVASSKIEGTQATIIQVRSSG